MWLKAICSSVTSSSYIYYTWRYSIKFNWKLIMLKCSLLKLDTVIHIYCMFLWNVILFTIPRQEWILAHWTFVRVRCAFSQVISMLKLVLNTSGTIYLQTGESRQRRSNRVEFGNGIYPIVCLDVMPLSNERGVSLWREYSFRIIA